MEEVAEVKKDYVDYELENWRTNLAADEEALANIDTVLGITDKMRERERRRLNDVIARLKNRIKKRDGSGGDDGEDWMQVARDWLAKQEDDIYYIMKQNMWLIRDADAGPETASYEFFKIDSLVNYDRELREPKLLDALFMVMKEQNCCYRKVTHSFNGVSDKTLNLLRRDEWVQPQEAKDYTGHHWIFDVLMCSLGGGKRENIEHLEHVIMWKFFHPEEYKLPCIVISGEGGAGKDLFVQRVGGAMYGGKQVLSTQADNILEQFNSLLMGKIMVLMNEAVPEKTKMEKIKAMVHSPWITINEKNVAQIVVDNCPLYFICCNLGDPIRLDRTNADRRFFVIEIPVGKHLGYWVAQKLSALEGRVVLEDEARDWIEDRDKSLIGNRAEVAKWLCYLNMKWGDKGRPRHLKTADFHAMLDRQRPMLDRLCEAVFTDPRFTAIEVKELYKAYRLLVRSYSSQTMFKNDLQFHAEVDRWLAANSMTAVAPATSNPNIIKGTTRDQHRNSKIAYYDHAKHPMKPPGVVINQYVSLTDQWNDYVDLV